MNDSETIVRVPHEVWAAIGNHRTPGYEYDSSRSEHHADGTVSIPLKASTIKLLKRIDDDYVAALRKILNVHTH